MTRIFTIISLFLFLILAIATECMAAENQSHGHNHSKMSKRFERALVIFPVLWEIAPKPSKKKLVLV